MAEKNSIMLLSDIIYKIHTIEKMDEMRKSMLESLQFLIPNRVSTFYLALPGSSYELTAPIGLGITTEECEEYLREFQSLDYTRWTFSAPAPAAFRETDLIRDELRVNTPYYKAMFLPAKIHYSVILTIIHNGTFLGVIDLYRQKKDGDFTDEELFWLDQLKEHLGFRLFAFLQQRQERQKKYPGRDMLMETYKLTLRESEIVYLLLDGLSKDTICEQLCISANTLKKHVLNIYKKLDIKSWRELFKLIQ